MAIPTARRPDGELPPSTALDFEEQSTVRYTAGYVVRNLRQHLERGSCLLREELIVCLEDACVDDDEEECSSAEWTKRINRGA